MDITSGTTADRIQRMEAAETISRKMDKIRKRAVIIIEITAIVKSNETQRTTIIEIEVLKLAIGEQKIMMTMRNRYAW
jgi:hypothetical protein